MKMNNVLKIFVVLVFSTAYVFAFTFFSAGAYNEWFPDSDTFQSGTKLGPADLSGKSKRAALQEIEAAVENWQKESVIKFAYKEKIREVHPSAFVFDYGNTVNSIKNGADNQAVVTVGEQDLTGELMETASELGSMTLDREKLTADILDAAKHLQPGSFTFQLEEYMANEYAESLNKSMVQTEDIDGEIAKLTAEKPIIVLAGTANFSLLEYLSEEGNNQITDDTLSKVATALYSVILPTNFTVLERHISKELPDYAKLGYEAKASQADHLDLIISNPNVSDYSVELSYENGTLSAVLIGNPFLYKYEIAEEGEEVFEPKTIAQFDPSIAEGQSMVRDPGKKGQIIQIHRVAKDESGAEMEKELLAEDFYAPSHKVELRGLIAPEVMEEDEPEDAESDEAESGENETEDGNQPADETNPDKETPETRDPEEKEPAEETKDEQPADDVPSK